MFRNAATAAYSKVGTSQSTTELVQSTTHDSDTFDASEEQQQLRHKSEPFKKRKKVLAAWRFTVTSGALAGTLILVINLVTLIVVYAKFGVVEDASVVFDGSCTTTNRVSIASHVIINVLSTILLAYSNYAMQCVAGPTREEIDKAHSKRRWLSIGTPTIRNFFYISPWKTCLGILLWTSSFPLHLLWNSAVFQTQVSNEYLAISVTPDLFTTTGSTVSLNDSSTLTYGLAADTANAIQRFQSLSNQQPPSDLVERLDPEECIKAYGKDAVATRRNVLLVVDPVNTTSANPILQTFSSDPQFPFRWMCDPTYTMNVFMNGGGWTCPENLLHAVSAGQQWIPGNGNGDNPVQWCYSEKISPQDQHCKVSIVPLFLIIVIICNAVKIASFLICLHFTRRKPPILTNGDAIASFLDRPDAFTRDRCLAAKYDFDKFPFRSKEWVTDGRPDIWTGGRYRWGKAVRGVQWTFSILCVSTCIMLAGAFYGPSGIGTGTTMSWPSVIWLGIGVPHRNFVNSLDSQPLLSGFLAANWPQLVVSYMYLFLSNMFTTMAGMAEFCGFATQAKGLRVSSPKDESEQRSTYFLSLPYRYAVPLMVSVATLHYFVSEMVFLARIDVYDTQGNLDSSLSSTNVYFSPLAMLIAVSLGSALVLALIVVGIFRKYPSTPLAGCCSASIAAACQPVPGQMHFSDDLALKKLSWGVVGYKNDVGHATFSADEVGPLLKNQGYL